MVRILHTADWHIGKQLHKYNLEADHQLFFDWLIEVIREREIDLLLVSGDIFDTSFPSNASLSLYYKFLTQLLPLNCRIVITGGNHDSPGVLNAPREILAHLRIDVVGDVTGFPAACYIPFPEWKLAVAAIPYLREADLRRSVSASGYSDRAAQIREGISQYYRDIVDYHGQHHPEHGLIGMGHLHVAGAQTSESEREIHIVGNLAAFGLEQFPGGFEYIALGHIHKPQKLNDIVRYSGSPVPLSFSERKDPKYVLELGFEDGRLKTIEPLAVPVSRELKSFTGTLDEVRRQLQAYSPVFPLEALVEVHVIEENYSPDTSLRFEQMLAEFSEAEFRIIKPRLTFENRRKDAADLFATGVEIEDLSPRQVFIKRLENEVLEEEMREKLLSAFDELAGKISME